MPIKSLVEYICHIHRVITSEVVQALQLQYRFQLYRARCSEEFSVRDIEKKVCEQFQYFINVMKYMYVNFEAMYVEYLESA